MRRRWQSWVRALTLTAGVLALLPVSGQISAQTRGRETGGTRVGEAAGGEVAPRLQATPSGEIFRLWYRKVDFREGKGAVFLATATPQNGWRSLLEVAPNQAGVATVAPDLAIGASGELAVAYQWRRHLPRSKQIRVASSFDGGKTWVHPSTPLDTGGAGFTPKVAWGGGRKLVVVWADERRQARAWDIYGRRSINGGASWEPEQVLSRFPQSLGGDLYARPELVSDGQNTFLAVWVGLRSGRSRLYLSRSVDGGRTWADPVELSTGSRSVYGHRLVRAGDRALVVWQDARSGRGRIYAVSSSDGGATWTSPTRVDHHAEDAAADAVAPTAVMGPTGEVFVAWHDSRHGRDDIYVARSADGGRTWDAEDTRLDSDEAGTAYSRFPVIARAADGRVAVAWEDDRVGYEGIHLRVRGTGDRATWAPEVTVAPPLAKVAARFPGLAWGKNGALHVSWEVWDYALGLQNPAKQIDGRVLELDKK
jgi:hypothetical protein